MFKILALTGLLLSAISANAAVMHFTFYQGGYAEGAYVTGSFSGEDLDGDNQLSFFSSEIYTSEMSFSGNSLVGVFSESNGVIVYDLDGGPLGDGRTGVVEGILMGGYLVGPGPNGIECGIGIDCSTVTNLGATDSSSFLVEVNQVPVPAAAWLFGSALIGLAGFNRKK